MCVLIFSTTFVWNISHSKKNWARYDQKCKLLWSSCKLYVILVRFWRNLNFLNRLFEIHSNIKFHENPSSRSRFVPCGQTDGRTEMTKLILAFRKFSKAPNANVDKAPKVRPTSSELTLYTTNYARCRQPTARIAVSSGPPSHSCHNKKRFWTNYYFRHLAPCWRFPLQCSYLVSNVVFLLMYVY